MPSQTHFASPRANQLLLAAAQGEHQRDLIMVGKCQITLNRNQIPDISGCLVISHQLVNSLFSQSVFLCPLLSMTRKHVLGRPGARASLLKAYSAKEQSSPCSLTALLPCLLSQQHFQEWKGTLSGVCTSRPANVRNSEKERNGSFSPFPGNRGVIKRREDVENHLKPFL